MTELRPLAERTEWPRSEIWDLRQIVAAFHDLGLERGRLGFELGDNLTLGISVDDFLRLREALPDARLVDGGPVIRRLMSVHTPLEIERLRQACAAGVWIHDQVLNILRAGITERKLLSRLGQAFRQQFGAGYAYQPAGGWDVRNPLTGDSNRYHTQIADRVFKRGD